MKPIKRPSKDFEKVAVGELLPGVIEEIQYDEDHVFKGFNGGEDTKQPGVRFVFRLDGYEHKHFSRWMKFTYGERSNLFNKYLAKLVPNAVPDMDYDLDGLKGMRVKTLWSEKNDFQNIDNIFPDKKPVTKAKNVPVIDIDQDPGPQEPF